MNERPITEDELVEMEGYPCSLHARAAGAIRALRTEIVNLESELSTAREILLQERELLRAEIDKLRGLLSHSRELLSHSGKLFGVISSGQCSPEEARQISDQRERKIRAALKEPDDEQAAKGCTNDAPENRRSA